MQLRMMEFFFFFAYSSANEWDAEPGNIEGLASVVPGGAAALAAPDHGRLEWVKRMVRLLGIQLRGGGPGGYLGESWHSPRGAEGEACLEKGRKTRRCSWMET